MIIVGNGSSILDRELGHKIDEFDEVLRFNEYRLRNKWTGEKTTHWWNTVKYQNLQHENLTRGYEECCLHSWDFREVDKFWNHLKDSVRAKEIFKSRESWIFELQQFAESNHYAFSTGLLAIWYYLKARDSVTIYGFDWWDREKHHAFDNSPRGNLHKPEVEKTIIDKLISLGRVKFL